MTQIEKIARLMGLELDKSSTNGGPNPNDGFDIMGNAVLDWHNNITFNPLTNKADLMDVECALSDKYTVNTTADENSFYIEVYDSFKGDSIGFAHGFMSDHPDKFTARAAAVCAVAEQIYDKGQV